jgi:hypothetical protein
MSDFNKIIKKDTYSNILSIDIVMKIEYEDWN